MNVAIVMSSGDNLSGGGGLERRFLRLYRYFQEHGYENIYVITEPAFLQVAENAGIPVDGSRILLVPQGTFSSPKRNDLFKPISYVLSSLRLWKIVRDNDIDILHFIFPYRRLIPFLLMPFSCKKKILSFVNNVYSQSGRFPNFKSSFIHHYYFNLVDTIDSFYSYFPVNFKRYSKKTRLAPCSFTDYSKFDFERGTKENWIVCAGRLEEYKGISLFLTAAIKLYAAMSDQERASWKVFLYGKGPMEEEIKLSINNSGLNDFICIDYHPRMYEILNKSKIFVSPHLVENNPSQSLLEAMAAENAVIVTDVGDTRRLVNEEVAVIIPPCEDKLALAMLDLVRDEAKANHLGKNARVFVTSNCTIEKFADYLMDIWVS